MNDKTDTASRATTTAQNLTYGLFGCKTTKAKTPASHHDQMIDQAA